MRASDRNDLGFTLVELLVSVAIVGILASIAIPAFSDYKRRAYDAHAISNITSMRTTMEAYLVDNVFAISVSSCRGDGDGDLCSSIYGDYGYSGINEKTYMSVGPIGGLVGREIDYYTIDSGAIEINGSRDKCFGSIERLSDGKVNCKIYRFDSRVGDLTIHWDGPY